MHGKVRVKDRQATTACSILTYDPLLSLLLTCLLCVSEMSDPSIIRYNEETGVITDTQMHKRDSKNLICSISQRLI